MLTNSVFFVSYNAAAIETVDEAVASLLDGNPVWTLNAAPHCGEVWVFPEALHTVWDRVKAAEAQDRWPGARFEADLVSPEPRRFRVAGSTTWRRYGNGLAVAIPTHVRA